MEIKIKATNIKLTDNITNYLNKRLSSLDKLIDKNDTTMQCNVEVGKSTERHHSGDVFRAEINLHTSGKDFRAVSEQSTLFAAIDEVKNQMQTELRRDKDRTLHLMKKGGAKIKEFMRGFKW